MQPHMHLRGKDATIEAQYPDRDIDPGTVVESGGFRNVEGVNPADRGR